MNIGAFLRRKSTVLMVSLVVLIASSVLLLIYGPGYFSDTRDPILYKYLVYGLGIVAGLGFLWHTYKSRTNTYLTALIKPALMAGLVMGAAFLLGLAALGPEGTGKIGSIDTDENIVRLIGIADELQGNGKLDASEMVLDDCLSQAKVPRYVQECEIKLAHVYYDQVDSLLDQRQIRCEYFNDRQGKGLALAKKYGESDLERLFQNQFEEVEEVCGVVIIPTPLPDTYSLEMIRTDLYDRTAVLDFRVIKNNTEQTMDLDTGNFVLLQGKNALSGYNFTVHSADDPVCIIAVVDNSGSIVPGIEKIRDGVAVLNEKRKPDDELGLVLFGDTAQEKRNPVAEGLNPPDVTGAERNTALWAGVEQGLNTAASCTSKVRYLVVLTDGANTVSFPGDDITAARNLAARAVSEKVNICPVGIRSESLNEEPLYSLATGCDYFSAAKLDDPSGTDLLASKIKEIVGFVHNFYRIELPGLGNLEDVYLQLYVSDQFVDEIRVELEP